MSGSPGDRLVDVLRRELITALRDAVTEIADELTQLDPDPAFAGSAFAGRVLEPPPLGNPVLAALGRLASAPAGGAQASLRGWRDEPVDGAPVGIAYVVSTGGAAVAALSLVPGDNPRVTLRAAGFSGGQSVDLPLESGFALKLSGTTDSGEVEVAFSIDQPPAVTRLGGSDRVDFDLSRPDSGRLLGVEGGPSVRLGSVSVGGWVAGAPADPFARGGHLRLEGGEVELAPGFVKDLLGIDLTSPLDLDLTIAPGAGVVLAGSPSLRTRLPSVDAGRWLDLAVDLPEAPDASGLDVSFLTSLDVSLPGTPIRAHVEGIGLRMPIALRLGAPMLPGVDGLTALEPDGAGVAVDLPVVSGSGMLTRVGRDLAGALAVEIPPMSASAFGLLSPPGDGHALSLLVIMGATFPPPGVQVGFGFAISGVGGVVGINRRVDRGALLRAVADGSAAQLLFPSDPVRAGKAAIAALPAVFPEARGSMVAGPMFQLSWGGRIVTLSVAVLVEAATQARLTIMGRLTVSLPDPEAPLVFLQATFAGFIDPAEPSVMFVASLTGSHIVGAPLSGDVLLLTRGGPDPTLVLSAGGFHPSYRVPRGVPALRRMSMDLCPAPWIDLRCESYFALTSNTLQLGARLELVAEVAGCGLRGWLAFDALVQYSPFRFIADVSAGIALRAFGETLAGIHLSLHLEGPAPWLARGRGSIDLFLFEVPFDFEVGWGSPPAQLDPPFDVAGELRRSLADPKAWRARGAAPPGLTLSGPAQKSLSDAGVADPYGRISVRQERVPLGIEIRRFNGIPVPPQRFAIVGGQFAQNEPARLVELRAEFAPGQFLAHKSDDEALTARAFESYAAGAELSPEPAAGAEARVAGLKWEESVIARDIPMPQPEPAGPIAEVDSLEAVLAAMSPYEQGWWVVPDEGVEVDPVPPLTTASSWSMGPGPDLTAPTQTEMLQAVEETSTQVMAVELWEMS